MSGSYKKFYQTGPLLLFLRRQDAMLVLTRKPSQSITLVLPSGETITIVLADSSKHRSSIGIEAPKDVKIIRTELLK